MSVLIPDLEFTLTLETMDGGRLEFVSPSLDVQLQLAPFVLGDPGPPGPPGPQGDGVQADPGDFTLLFENQLV